MMGAVRLALSTPRYVLLWLCCLNALVSYADRTNIAIAILPMATEFNWSKSRRGFVLSAFYYGYACTQLPGGYLAQRVGGKWLLAGSCALWSLFTALTPVAARAGMPWLILCRISLGLSEGGGFPAIMALIAEHVPPHEHSRSIAFVFGGCYAGAIIANIVSSRLIMVPESSGGGWPSIFYLFGGIGLLWLVPWLSLAMPPPASALDAHGKVSRSADCVMEMDTRRGATDGGDGSDSEDTAPLHTRMATLLDEQTFSFTAVSPQSATSPKTMWHRAGTAAEDTDSATLATARASGGGVPWRKLFCTWPVFAYLVANFTQAWSFWLMINWLPAYYQDQFHADIKDIGIYTILPYAVQGIMGNVSGMAADALINKRGVRKVTVRRWMQFCGMVGMSLFTLLAVLIPQNIEQGAALITTAMGLYTLTFAGVSVNHLDIAPRFAATVYGIGNTAGQIPGIVGVWLTGWMLDVTDGNWLVVFGVAAVISVLGATVWVLLCSADPLPLQEDGDVGDGDYLQGSQDYRN